MQKRHLTPLLLLALLSGIIFSCMTEKQFFTKYGNNKEMGVRTTSVSEILQNASRQEVFFCQEDCGPVKEELALYRKRYAEYVRSMELYAKAGPVCPCDTSTTGSCIWSKRALEEIIIDDPRTLEVRIENPAGDVLSMRTCPANMVAGSKNFLSLAQFPEVTGFKEDTLFVIVRAREEGRGIFEKSMMVLTGPLE